jgi:carboxyl-terminal processing protease
MKLPTGFTWRNIISGLLILAAILVAFLIGFFGRDWVSNQPDMSIAVEAFDILNKNGYNDIPQPPALQYGMIRGMLQAYNDPFTTFYEPPQHAVQTDQLAGKFGGIGVRLERDAAGFFRMYPTPDSPASKAGVLDADRLVSVGGVSMPAGVDQTDVEAAIRGPVGPKVTLVVAQPPDFTKTRQLTITRAEFALPSMTWNLLADHPQIGIIHISIMADTTPQELVDAVAKLKTQGATSFILDLRNNGGGLLDTGINVARLFLRQGLVINEQYRGRPVQPFNVEKPGVLADVPIVVVVNENTASAAEIAAGALQSQKRARLVGATTYGKDTIQEVYELKDGSSLHVTVAHWLIPGIEVPLTPDLVVKQDPQVDSQVDAAVQVLTTLHP